MNVEEVEKLKRHVELMRRCYFMGFVDELVGIYQGCYLYKTSNRNRNQNKKGILDALSLLEEHYKTLPFEELECNANLAPLYVIPKLLPAYEIITKEFEKTGAKWLETIDDLKNSLENILSGITEYEWLEFRDLLVETGTPSESVRSDITSLFTINNKLSEYKKKVKQFLGEPSKELYEETERIWGSIDNICLEGLGQDIGPQVQLTIIAIGKWFVRTHKDPIKELYEKSNRMKDVITTIPYGDLYRDIDELKKVIENLSFEGLEFDFAPLFVVRDILPKYSQKVKQFLKESNNRLYKRINILKTAIGYVEEIYRRNFKRRIAELRSTQGHENYEVTIVRYDGQKYGI